jgi:hypothetical protein
MPSSALGAVFRSTLHPAGDADCVERAADDVIAHAGQVLDAAATDEHERVLLEVVAHARDVGRHFDAVGQPHAGDLAQRGVRLLRRLGEDPDAHAPLLRAVLERGALGLADDLLATVPDQLTDSRHKSFVAQNDSTLAPPTFGGSNRRFRPRSQRLGARKQYYPML